MNFQEIFTVYWGQTTLLLLAIGYLIKRIFDNKSKKLEINHTLFQKNKLTAIETFFQSYAKTELMWNQLQIFEIVSNKLPAKEIDKIIIPTLNELRKSIIELRIYFNPKIYKHFEQIGDNFIYLNKELMDIYFWERYEKKSATIKSNRFGEAKSNVIKNNNEQIEIISNNIKKIFK